jgi:EmrB/QacA subfamily drug resistance transporter
VINPKARPCDEATIRSTQIAPDCVALARPWVLVVTILASTMAYIDESVVNVALPAIERDLGTSVAVIQWLVNAYTLSLSAFLLIGGAAGDQFGRRRIFVIGTGIFAAASLWCGVSPTTSQLILARAAQGVGAALLIPCSLAIIGASFEEAERGRAIGTWAGFSAIAAAIGPLLGGFIVDHSSWRLIFLINPVIALPTILLAMRRLTESRDPEAASSLDWRGAILAFAALGGVVFGLIAWPDLGWYDPIVITSLVLGSVLLIAFAWVEGKSPAPMMPLGLFRSRTFTGVNLLTLLLYAALGGAFFFLPFDLIQVHGYSATLAGTVFLPFTIIMAGLSRWSGGLLDRYGARPPLIVGPTIAAVGFALLGSVGVGGPYWATFLPPIVVLGLGMAVTVAPLTTSVINAVPARQAGVASGINNAVASLANLLAVAGLGAIALTAFNHALDHDIATQPMCDAVRQILETARGKFVIDAGLAMLQGEERAFAESLIKQSLAESIRLVMWLAAAVALLGAACAAFTIRPDSTQPKP